MGVRGSGSVAQRPAGPADLRLPTERLALLTVRVAQVRQGYIALNVSDTTTEAPPARTGHIPAALSASSSESALMIE
jgi:hypothetical protein